MTFALGILTFFVILAILVLVHELGHFGTAKLFGVRVEEFGLGFPPRLKTWQRGGTTYSLNALPLGGFVKMQGENGEDQDPDSFGAKPPWQRLIVLLAGPCMNLLLALAIFFFVYEIGAPRVLTVISGVAGTSPAASAGLTPGDRIVAVDGKPVTYFSQLDSATRPYLGHRVDLLIERHHHLRSVGIMLRAHPPAKEGPMGITLARSVNASYGPGQSLEMAGGQVAAMAGSVPALIQSLSRHGAAQVAGPIGMAHLTTQVVGNEPRTGPGSVLQFMAFLSANLGVLNLLPIPALDGGRILFVLISWLRRRNLDPQLEGMIHLVGTAALLLAILAISYQDILHWLSGSSF